MTFGDGTPISLVTIAGQEIIDDNGIIVHGLQSCSVNGVSGSVNCGIQQVASIPTLEGRVPTVQLDTQYPAQNYSLAFNDPDNPSAGTESSSAKNGTPVHTTLIARAGSFSITNNNTAEVLLREPSSQYYDPSLATAECGYRWL